MHYFKTILIALICLIQGSYASSKKQLRVYIPDDVYTEYMEIKLKNIQKIEEVLKLDKLRRDVVEVFLYEKIVRDICECKLIFTRGMNYRRALKALSQGRIDGVVNPIWEVDGKLPNIVTSDAIIERGEFMAVLYTGDRELTNVKTTEEIYESSIVTNPHWTVDYKTVTKKFKNITTAVTWDSIAKLVANKRVRYTLAPLANSKNHTINYNGKTLYPLKGHKIALDGRRVLAIHKRNAYLLAKINDQIQKYKANQLITQAYQASGFFSPIISKWLEL